MIGLARNWSSSSWIDPSRIGPSLGLFAGKAADSERFSDTWLFELDGPRGKPRHGWRASRTRSGLPILLYGWIDNPEALAAQLGTAYRSFADLYGAAFEAWGDRADSRICGTFVTIIPLPDGRIRLSRSPIGSYPLFYAADADGAVVCSIPRPIFAAGWPQRLRLDYLSELLALQFSTDQEASLFENLHQVPDGTIAYLSPSGIQLDRWYDLLALPEIRLKRDEDYVEAANALLADAARNALAIARRPAVTLSGGLDSAIVTDEVLRHLPQSQRLDAYSFHPLDEWSGKETPNVFSDERPHVREFVRMHPRIDLHLIDNRGIGFDHRASEFHLACSTAYPAMTVGTTHYGVWEAAAAAGHDFVLSATTGNMSFSNGAPWAFPEFLLKGKWRQLWRLAAARQNDPRSIPRRILALAAMPLLPETWQDRIRDFVHPGRVEIDYRKSLFLPDTDHSGTLAAAVVPDAISKRGWLKYVKSQLGIAAEISHGYEQVFGIRARDVSHYRPLLEFCFSLPTSQFVRDGQDRWLARRMAAGRMPEAQRLERRYGRQNADWYPRMTPRLDELKAMVERMASQPMIGHMIDIDRARYLLDNWPDEDPGFGQLENDLRFTLASTIYMSQYVDFVTGRN